MLVYALYSACGLCFKVSEHYCLKRLCPALFVDLELQSAQVFVRYVALDRLCQFKVGCYDINIVDHYYQGCAVTARSDRNISAGHYAVCDSKSDISGNLIASGRYLLFQNIIAVGEISYLCRAVTGSKLDLCAFLRQLVRRYIVLIETYCTAVVRVFTRKGE